MKEILLKIKKSLLTPFSRKQLFFVFAFILSGLFLFFLPTNAETPWAVDVIGGILGLINSALGSILLLIVNTLINVAGYQEFINNSVVETGWKMVRDLCNMFFVVVLLVIAFSSIVPVSDKYNKKLLPKMILMAVLINYSKTICGLLIDVSQIVMLTFVNAFQQAAGGNFTELLGISEIVRIAEGSDAISGWAVIAAYVFGTIYLLIAIVTVVAILAMLIVRIVMIWIYVVISPAAYLLNSFPQGQSYSKKWWSEFTSNLISGPVLAFFLWLSLASMSKISLTGGNDAETLNRFGGSAAMNTTSLGKFAISIAMLMGGLKIASSLGGAGGSIAGQAVGKINSGRKFVGKKIREKTVDPIKKKGIELAKTGGRFAKDTTKAGLSFADRMVGAGVDKVSSKLPGKRVTNFANQGLMTTMGMGLVTAPGKVKNIVKSSLRGSEEKRNNADALRSYHEKQKTDSNAKLKWTDGKEYEEFTGANGEKGFREVGNASNVLKDSKNNNVLAMSSVEAAWHDSSKRSYAKSMSIADKADKKKIEEKTKELEDLDMNADEMNNRFNSAASSATEKKALAMMMAKKGAFKNTGDIKRAEGYLQENKSLVKDFSDEIDKKQPELHYDLTTAKGSDAFKKKLDDGKINLESLNPKVFESGDMLNTMKSYFSDEEFKNVVRNLSRKKKTASSISTGLLNRSFDGNHNITDNTRDYAQLYAEISGNIDQVFSSGGQLNVQEFEKYVESASAAGLSKIDSKKPENREFIDHIARKISLSKLKKISKNSDNDSLVEAVVNRAIELNNKELKDGIYKDNELSSKLSDSNKRRRQDNEEEEREAEYDDGFTA